MTTPSTLPLADAALDAHEHGWDVDSRHTTSEGTVLYVVCAGCGARRVDLHPNALMPPIALSVTTPRRA